MSVFFAAYLFWRDCLYLIYKMFFLLYNSTMKTNSSLNNKNLVTPPFGAKDSLVFTVATLIPLLLSILTVFILSLTLGNDLSLYQDEFWYYLLSYLLSSLGIALSVIFFCLITKRTPFRGIGFNKFAPKYLVLIPVLAFGTLYGLGNINDWFVEFLRTLGYSKADMTIPNETLIQYAVWIPVVCILPAILEETLFRGYLFKSLNFVKPWVRVLVCGFLFALFHQNPQQTPYQFINGIIFCLIVERSGSIIPAVIMHFINNFTIITFDYFFGDVVLSSSVEITLFAIGMLMLFGGLFYLIFIDKKQKDQASTAEKTEIKREWKTFLLYSAFGIIMCAVMWIASLFG